MMVGNLNTWRSHWCWCHSLKIDWEPCIRDLKCASSLQLGQGSIISVWFLDLNIRICDSEHFHISSFKFSQFLNYFVNIRGIWDESSLKAYCNTLSRKKTQKLNIEEKTNHIFSGIYLMYRVGIGFGRGFFVQWLPSTEVLSVGQGSIVVTKVTSSPHVSIELSGSSSNRPVSKPCIIKAWIYIGHWLLESELHVTGCENALVTRVSDELQLQLIHTGSLYKIRTFHLCLIFQPPRSEQRMVIAVLWRKGIFASDMHKGHF